MLLDIAQHDYIPFVTDSAGIRMAIHNTHFKPILTSEGISISSQFETNIALKQVRIKSSYIYNIYRLNNLSWSYIIYCICRSNGKF